MAEQRPPPDNRVRTAPFVNDAADAPDQEPAGRANMDRAIAAEKALRARHPDAGTIPQAKDRGGVNDATKPGRESD